MKKSKPTLIITLVSVAIYESVFKRKKKRGPNECRIRSMRECCRFVSELRDNQFRKCYQVVEMNVIVKYE